MPLLSPAFRHGLRDSAQRLGLADFWRWWMGEIGAAIPARLRNALQRRRLRPALMFGAEAAVLWEPQAEGGSVTYAETARIPLVGDPGQVSQVGRSAMDALAKRTGRAGPVRVLLALARGQVLRKLLTYPSAVEPNLQQVLGYDLDRHTPFKAEELYYDAAIVGRDSTRDELRIELVAALRPMVDQLRRQASGWGAEVAAIVPELPHPDSRSTAAARLDLLPEAERTDRTAWRRWQIWVPVVLALALVAAALAIPLADKRAAAIALVHQNDQARAQATAADALRQKLEQAVDDYNFVLSRKYAYPSTVQLLEDVTRILPDDTWLTQLELKSMPKGKEPHREILLRGESANAGRLVSLLEDSQLFEQAAPRSPTTKIQPGPGEIFDLGAQLKPQPMPSSVDIATAGSLGQGPGDARGQASAASAAPAAPASAAPPAANVAKGAAPPATPAPANPAPGAASPKPGSATPPANAAVASPPPVPPPRVLPGSPAAARTASAYQQPERPGEFGPPGSEGRVHGASE